MRRFLIGFLSLLLVFIVTDLSNAQTLTAKIKVKGVTPNQMATGRYDVVSSGLPNVGKGQKVWLEAWAIYGSGTSSNKYDTVLTESWSVVNPPGGFATIVHTDTTTYFIPDTTGQYQVNLSITTSHGSANTSMYINSAKWTGVGGIVGSPDIMKGECASCHSLEAATWQGTNHATAFARKVDDASGYFAGYCVSCHTVGYDNLPTAVNNGFDDLASMTGWMFPTPLQQGNWDAMKTNYPSVAKLANIQCENCHGPGTMHMGAKDKNKMVASIGLEACAQCHDAAPYHMIVNQWQNSLHAISPTEGSYIEYTNRTSCAKCHIGQGYIRETINGQATQAPYPDAQPITCAVCHDPHETKNPAQLRRASLADACTGCHTTRFSGQSGLHHSHQGQMLIGIDGTPYSGQSGSVGDWGGWELPGYTYNNSAHSDISDRCVDCHMAAAPNSQTADKLGGHTFSILWDNDTPTDETDDVVNPTGCTECHGTVTTEFLHLSKEPIKALLEELRLLLPHRTSGDTTQPRFPQDTASPKLTQIQKASSYNYYFVNNDGSFGIHNHKYSEQLLQSSIEQLKLGAGAASITTVKDVPNDQGKQVQVVWNQFPAEKYSFEPVVSYIVLRQDSATGFAKTSAVKVSTYREMLSKVADANRVILAGSVWTKVGEYKAINLPLYSLVVPTLFDSTIIDGLKQSSFVIVGYTASKVTYTSASMSGYSIDNLAPLAPAIAVQSGSSVVLIDMNAPTDADFKYFAIYRGISPDFIPSGTPLGTTAEVQYTDASVTIGATYYYKASAFDFSGNESKYSNEVSVIVSNVSNELGVPKEFALRQNHPNPFNPTTAISYELPNAAHVKISVYNALGMKVATLVDGEQNAGYQSVTWNGKDDAGVSVASGIYLYKMDAGSMSFTRKMILMK